MNTRYFWSCGRRWRLVMGLFAVLGTLAGCGGGSGDTAGGGGGGADGGGVTPVVTAPTITAQPMDTSVISGASATFTITATGTSPLAYRWRRNGADIVGATAASYTTPALGLADSGAVFSVVVSNGAGSVTSADARLTVTSIAAAPRISKVEVGLNVHHAITSDGELFATGEGRFCTLGSGETTDRGQPVSIGMGWRSVSGRARVLALKDDGSLWGWGVRIGDGTAATRCAPVRLGDGFVAAHSASHVGEGGAPQAIAVKADGTLWLWLPLDAPVPTQHGSDTDWVDAVAGNEHYLALKRDGSLWAFGRNDYGQLGLGFTETALLNMTPRKVGDGYRVIATGNNASFAITTAGELRSWGSNLFGLLGDNTTTDRASPTPIGSDFVAVDASTWVAAAVKADGSVWAWGVNRINGGYVGDGTDVPRTTPTRIIAGGQVGVSVSENGSVAWDASGGTQGWGEYGFRIDAPTGNLLFLNSRSAVAFDFFGP